MSNLNGTKTHENLKDAFAGESQARNKYEYFAKVAQKEGYRDIAEHFKEQLIMKKFMLNLSCLCIIV